MCKPVRPRSYEQAVLRGATTNIASEPNEGLLEINFERRRCHPRGPNRASLGGSSSGGKPAVIIQHNYHDHVHDKPPSKLQLRELKIQTPSGIPFPIKLHDLLEKLEKDGFADVISWQPHGRSFAIRKPNQLINLLPLYYNKLSKIASFQRQLNLYGFQRLTKGADKGSYYHELFLRGKKHLAYQIPRTKIKGTGVRGKSNPDQEPDLFSMEWVSTSQGLGASPSESQETVSQAAPANAPRTGVQPGGSETSLSSSETAAATGSLPHVETEWGRSFYSLDLKPEELFSVCSQPRNPASQPYASVKSCPDLEDDRYMETILDSMAETPDPKSGEDDLAYLLEQIASV